MTTTTGTIGELGRYRLMGGLAMAGAIGYIAAGLIFSLGAEGDNNVLGNVLSLLWTLGCLCGLVGIGMLGIVGSRVFGRIALAAAMLAYALAALDAMLILMGIYTTEGSPLFAISRLGTLVGMLLVSSAALVARRWLGWRKFSPFALPLALPLAIAIGALIGGIPMTIPVYIGLAWLIIGYAVVSTHEAV